MNAFVVPETNFRPHALLCPRLGQGAGHRASALFDRSSSLILRPVVAHRPPAQDVLQANFAPDRP